MKCCKKCKLNKEDIEFFKYRALKSGISNVCKNCQNLKNRLKTLNKKNEKILNGEIKVKICNICGISKILSKFNESKKTNDGRLDGCIDCKRGLKLKNKKQTLELELDIKKVCKKCKIEKNIFEFYKSPRVKDGHFNNCIECEKTKSLSYHHNFKKANKNKNRPFDKNLSKLKKVIRTSIINHLKLKGYKKGYKTTKILGCNYEEFKIYLESKFEPWMNWGNRGLYNGELNYGWDIDHIIPASIAKNEDELLKLNHYTNLQPLCSKINRDIKRNEENY